ncbi:MAG: hypothetical protein CMK03_07645 [Ponticaulis sp.]|nr:hypothetical protein [Ponticaulis sp.]
MVIGYHLIFGAYGFWLPNDPRGSWSTEVWAKRLRPFGEATKVDTRRSVAHRSHDHDRRREAKEHLKYPALQFTGAQARAVGRGFARILETLEMDVHACSIMPDHVHLATGRCGMSAEDLAGFLKRAATRELTDEAIHPMAGYHGSRGRVPTPWARRGWTVFLETPEEIRRCVRYVKDNPVNAGLPRQRWDFETPYDG